MLAETGMFHEKNKPKRHILVCLLQGSGQNGQCLERELPDECAGNLICVLFI